jgi:hypothetical protein
MVRICGAFQGEPKHCDIDFTVSAWVNVDSYPNAETHSFKWLEDGPMVNLPCCLATFIRYIYRIFAPTGNVFMRSAQNAVSFGLDSRYLLAIRS